MIHKLYMTNFQSHKHSELEFHPGVNVIVGASDSGKTALLRALYWIIKNRPSGESFRSHWGGDTVAQIEINRGHRCSQSGNDIISRERGKEGNRYTVVSEGEGGSLSIGEFKAVGRDVPEEISKLLNMNDINIQNQMDAPFLLYESPAEVARVFNRIASLDLIDHTHSNINAMVRENQQAYTSKKSQLESLENSLDDFFFLEKMESRVVRLENLEKKIRRLENLEKKVVVSLASIRMFEEKRKEISRVVKLKKRLDRILERGEEIKRKEEEVGRLRGIFSPLTRFTAAKKEISKVLEGWENSFKQLMPEVCPLCGRGGE